MEEKFKKPRFRKVERFGNTLPTNKFICFYCNCKIDDYSRTIDHLVPVSKGGIRSNDNKVPCCRDCNQLKSNMDVSEFQRLINAMLGFEISSSRKRIGYLKKLSLNVERLIKNRKKND